MISGATSAGVASAGPRDERDPGQPGRLQRQARVTISGRSPIRSASAPARGAISNGASPGQQPQPGAERVLAQADLQELRHEEHHAGQRRRSAGRSRRCRPRTPRGGTAASAPSARRPAFPADERARRAPRRRPAPRSPRGCPSPPCCRGPAPRPGRARPPVTSTRPGRSTAGPGPVARDPGAQDQRDRDQADRHVEPEDPLPGDALGDRAADDRPGHRPPARSRRRRCRSPSPGAAAGTPRSAARAPAA